MFTFYCQEGVSHARWITTASGYLRTLIFGYGVEPHYIPKLQRMASFIVCVCSPAFLAIHLKPSAADGPSITLFTKDLLLAYKDIDEPIFNAVQNHFVHHSSQWLNPKNIALSVHAEVPPFTLEAVKEKTFPKQINMEQMLWKRGTLRDFFTEDNKMAPCITSVSVLQMFWRNIDNNNRGTELLLAS